MPAGLTLVLTSPRVADGVLSWSAWTALQGADTVLGRLDEAPGQAAALAEAGVELTQTSADEPRGLARELVAAAASGQAVVWLGSPDGDPGLTDALADELSRIAVDADPPPIEVVVGSHDVPGARLLDLVAVMDRLRSPGGCPWDAEQTHASLTPYLLEEAHEAVEAIEAGDRAAIREELGDVLLQVAFHARVAQEDPDDPFDVDDVAAGIVAKLVRRHPHVFADVDAPTAEHVEANWDRIKAAEKGRASALDGVPVALPALARADAVLGRIERLGVEVDADAHAHAVDEDDDGAPGPGDVAFTQFGERLLTTAREARSAGVDAEAALRAAVRRVESRARRAESARAGSEAESDAGSDAGPEGEVG